MAPGRRTPPRMHLPLQASQRLKIVVPLLVIIVAVFWLSRKGFAVEQSPDAFHLSRFKAEKPDSKCSIRTKELESVTLKLKQIYGTDIVSRSQVSQSHSERLSRLLRKLISGQPITILTIGGSITASIDLIGGLETGNGSFAGHIRDWLNEVFPTASGAPHTLIRSFLPGAGSFFHRFCWDHVIKALWLESTAWQDAMKADLVILEVSANDWVRSQPGMATVPQNELFVHAEALVRQLLSLPTGPVTSFLHFGVHQHGAPHNSTFLRSGEFPLDVVSSYYGLMAVSVWRAFHPLVASQGQPRSSQVNGSQFSYKDYFLDKSHPTQMGHKAAGDLFTLHLFSGFLSVLTEHSDVAEELSACLEPSAMAASLPPSLPAPLQPGVDSKPYCAMAERWKVLQNGHQRFRKGLKLRKGRGFHGSDPALWQLSACGPLLPRMKCWLARAANQTLTLSLRLKAGEYSRLGFVYRIRNFQVWQDRGAHVGVNGRYFKFLPIAVEGNTLTHWWLDFDFVMGGSGVTSVDFTPNSDSFDIIAVVAA